MDDSTSHDRDLDRRSRAGLRSQAGTIAIAFAALMASSVDADPLTSGNVLVGQDVLNTSGMIRELAPDGAFVQTLDTTTLGGLETGMCFDAAGNLYTTNFLAHSMSKFSSGGTLLSSTYIDFGPATPSSCVFDAAGHLYVGLSDADASTTPGGGGGSDGVICRGGMSDGEGGIAVPGGAQDEHRSTGRVGEGVGR